MSSKSAKVKCLNYTTQKVTFGLCSSPHDHYSKVTVDGANHGNPGIEILDIDDPDARSIAAWIDSNTLYPNNNNPYVDGYFFESGKNYYLTLTEKSLEVSTTPPNQS